MLITTSENIAGYKICETKGECFGIIVRSRGLVGNIFAFLRTIFGGEIKEYSQMLQYARDQAIDRMVVNARAKGGNAIIMMRFDGSEIGGVMNEVVAYGTAVVIEKVVP